MIKTFKFDDQNNISEVLLETRVTLAVGDLFYINYNYMLITKILSNRRGSIIIDLVRKSSYGKDLYTRKQRLYDMNEVTFSNKHLDLLSPEQIAKIKEEILETLIRSGNIYNG